MTKRHARDGLRLQLNARERLTARGRGLTYGPDLRLTRRGGLSARLLGGLFDSSTCFVIIKQ